MRPIAATFVVAPPAGVRVRARLKVDAGDEAVLGVIGEHLGSLAGKDLAARCKEGPLDASPRPFGAARWRISSLSKASSSSSSRGHDAPRRRLIEDGAVLRYRGNFDWPGVAIANRVITYFGAVPWRMGRADYEAALAGAGRGLVDLPALAAPRGFERHRESCRLESSYEAFSDKDQVVGKWRLGCGRGIDQQTSLQEFGSVDQGALGSGCDEWE